MLTHYETAVVLSGEYVHHIIKFISFCWLHPVYLNYDLLLNDYPSEAPLSPSPSLSFVLLNLYFSVCVLSAIVFVLCPFSALPLSF